MASMNASCSSPTCQVRTSSGMHIRVFTQTFPIPSLQFCSIQVLLNYLQPNSIYESFPKSFKISHGSKEKSNKNTFFLPFLKSHSKCFHLKEACISRRQFLRVLMCAHVSELMISSKQTALHSYTDIILDTWCAPGAAALCSASTEQSIAAPWN